MRFVIYGLLLFAVGCGGSAGYAPVSGVITIDGQPYGQAVVSFQPMATSGNPNPGRGSSAYTDASGKFVLMSDNGDNGAVIGKHRVRIMTRGGNVVGQSASGVSGDGAPTAQNVDPIPPEWNALSEKEFEVPASGTDQANFDIVTKK